jgi:hypothetical protein
MCLLVFLTSSISGPECTRGNVEMDDVKPSTKVNVLKRIGEKSLG